MTPKHPKLPKSKISKCQMNKKTGKYTIGRIAKYDE